MENLVSLARVLYEVAVLSVVALMMKGCLLVSSVVAANQPHPEIVVI